MLYFHFIKNCLPNDRKEFLSILRNKKTYIFGLERQSFPVVKPDILFLGFKLCYRFSHETPSRTVLYYDLQVTVFGEVADRIILA